MSSYVLQHEDTDSIALREFNTSGKYRQTCRLSSYDDVSLSSTCDPLFPSSSSSSSSSPPTTEPLMPGLRKRLSIALGRSKSSTWDSFKWRKRASLSWRREALSSRRSSTSSRGSQANVDDGDHDDDDDDDVAGKKKRWSRRYSLPLLVAACAAAAGADSNAAGEKSAAPRMSCVFTVGHSTLFVPF